MLCYLFCYYKFLQKLFSIYCSFYYLLVLVLVVVLVSFYFIIIITIFLFLAVERNF